MSASSAHQRAVLDENFGCLGPSGLSEFLGEVIEQLQSDLRAILQGSPTEIGAALHRIAGSAPAVGCLSLGDLARAAMSSPGSAPPAVEQAVLAAVGWLEQVRQEFKCPQKEPPA